MKTNLSAIILAISIVISTIIYVSSTRYELGQLRYYDKFEPVLLDHWTGKIKLYDTNDHKFYPGPK